MKKLLIATAALAMVAGTAQAQSSVTVYGAVGASNNSISTNSVDAAAQFQSNAQDYLGTTALGLKGTEDLGGGNKAFFMLEGDLSMAGGLGGTVTSTTTAAENDEGDLVYTTKSEQSIFNRHAHVGIETKQFGTFSFGRQNDSIKDLEGLGQVYNLSDNLHIFTAVGDRYAQIYKYATPTFSGLKATYSYSNGADNATNITTDGAKTLNSGAVSYTYQNYNFGIGKGVVTEVSKDDLKTTYVGARGTFGNLTVGAHYSMNEQGSKELKQTMVSANYAIGNIDLKAHYVTNDASGENGVDVIGSQSTTNGNGNNDGDGYGLMAVYNMSKRTAAYVGYADFDATDSTLSTKVTTVGLLHKF